jgi:hypothetical protein
MPAEGAPDFFDDMSHKELGTCIARILKLLDKKKSPRPHPPATEGKNSKKGKQAIKVR